MRPILTADDYGMTRGVSQAILDLAAARRLSATSCMTNMPAWPYVAEALRPHRGHMSIGLHVNLTLGLPLTRNPLLTRKDGRFRSLSEWIMGPFDRLGREALEEEISAQVAMFIECFGHPPDHIDGHQHVHLMPGVRQRFFAVLKTLDWTPRPLVRDTTQPSPGVELDGGQRQKQLSLKALGLGFGRGIRKLGFQTNTGFAGYSNFKPGTDYKAEISKALDIKSACAIVMCHPGHVDAELKATGDPVVRRRQEELAGLMSLDNLPSRIWQPARDPDGAPFDWHLFTQAPQEKARHV
ncbi:MAG: hypothetical protein RL291_1090 [Pseudomonadota bacterium]